MFDMQCIDPTSVGDIDYKYCSFNLSKVIKTCKIACKSQLACQVHSNLDSFRNVFNGVQTLAPQGINFLNMSNALLLNQKDMTSGNISIIQGKLELN
jgi:hypothetical protein